MNTGQLLRSCFPLTPKIQIHHVQERFPEVLVVVELFVEVKVLVDHVAGVFLGFTVEGQFGIFRGVDFRALF